MAGSSAKSSQGPRIALGAAGGALWAPGLPHWVGGLLLACAAGVLFIEHGGMFGLGLALPALGVWRGA